MPSADSTVLFRAIPVQFRLTPSERKLLEHFAISLKQQVANNRPFICLITNDRELRKLNSTFLGHDYPTDVLSFPAEGGSLELGELAISIEQADQQACAFGHSRFDELRVLLLHGVLHLTGLDHETDSGEMDRCERHWRETLKLPSSLITREPLRAQA